jgi:hypothetical protein
MVGVSDDDLFSIIRNPANAARFHLFGLNDAGDRWLWGLRRVEV